jgi:Fe-S-cluster-containing hydrogenase component 2
VSKILYQKTKSKHKKTIKAGWNPIRLTFAPGKNTMILFSNQKTAFATCLGCQDAPCVFFKESEITPANFDGFPVNRCIDVCATGAIRIGDNGLPLIDNEKCILCGACASRCPLGAIRLVAGRGAVIEVAPNEAFLEATNSDSHNAELMRNLFQTLPTEGVSLIESDDIVNEITSKIQKAAAVVGDQFPNLLTRNLLISSGNNAAISRKGNNFMRMDIVLSNTMETSGVVEVEFGQDANMEAPRDVLDSIAVLVSRYNWTIKNTASFIVTDLLPNRRSEYWHIIQDINNVFGIKIGTITIFCLMLLNWNRKKLILLKNHNFYADRAIDSYRAEVLEPLMQRKLKLNNLPNPLVDIAK